MKLPIFTRGEIVIVEWIDIEQNTQEWHTEESMDKELEKYIRLYTNVGFYYGENLDYYLLYSGISPDNTYFDFVKIPKGCVKTINYVAKKLD